jgi:HSP20 family protein
MLMNNFTNQERETERRCAWSPATNIIENEEAFMLEMAVPGFSKKDFKINLEKNTLTISSEKEEKAEDNEAQSYRMREFNRKDFCRSFKIPETVNVDDIKAGYKNGILTLTLPKKEEVKLRKEIQVA